MFTDDTIKRRVMEVVKTRIATAQKQYDEKTREMDIVLHDKIAALHVEREKEAVGLADELVVGILNGK